ncbi:MAG: class I SAM-dependent methyltransferase [Phycisphaeraceae bacterium]|nr:class I SAM-dependent methyltransferase [Phycisphaeraceae bacterium]
MTSTKVDDRGEKASGTPYAKHVFRMIAIAIGAGLIHFGVERAMHAHSMTEWLTNLWSAPREEWWRGLQAGIVASLLLESAIVLVDVARRVGMLLSATGRLQDEFDAPNRVKLPDVEDADTRRRVMHIATSIRETLELIAQRTPAETRQQYARCYDAAISEVNAGIASKHIRLQVEGVSAPRILDLIRTTAAHADRVVATCFTKMDDFWCTKTGLDYLELNLSLLRPDPEYNRNQSLQMERIFGVMEKDGYRDNIKLREVIRLLRSNGCECHVRSPLTVSGSSPRDLFILLRKDAPLMGIEWDVDRHGTALGVTVQLPGGALDELYAAYRKLRAAPSSGDLPEGLHELRGVAASKAYLERLNETYIRTNSLQYLRNAPRSPDGIAEYWRKLEGTIVRPSTKTMAWMSDQIASKMKTNGRIERICILGCTPEVRELVATTKTLDRVRVELVDLSQAMYDGMNAFIRRSPHLDDRARERCAAQVLLPINWLGLDLLRKAQFDLVLGVDVLNMLPRDGMKMLLDRISQVLRPGGSALLQMVCHSPERMNGHSQMVDRMPQRATRRLAKAASHNHHDLFVDIAFDLCNAAEDLPKLNLPEAYDWVMSHASDAAHGSFVDTVRSTYAHCHSVLSLVSPSELFADGMRPRDLHPIGNVQDAYDGKLRFTGDMHMFRFDKQ